MNGQPPVTVSAEPVKRFFVDMLTRDIQLEDAILDLLDNCVDGILRTKGLIEGIQLADPNNPAPYEGFWARIAFTEDAFSIEDNCGGIPWNEIDRVFRMGRPPTPPGQEERRVGIGVYGIGMKRAIFKLGKDALVLTQNQNHRYQVPITAAWIDEQDLWDLTVYPLEPSQKFDGTTISVTTLHEGVRQTFSAESFHADLLQKIRTHYAVIISKGFKVYVNNVEARSEPLEFRFSGIAEEVAEQEVIRPYIFRTITDDDVSVFVAVGLREPLPTEERINEEQQGTRYSSDHAGWTIICNDRVVLYCNKDEMTGWGTATVPRYHTQFIAISGIVEFIGDPKKLPTNTTKRGLDFSSRLYQRTLDRMREGLKIFTGFTNDWKAREEDVRKRIEPIPAIPYSSLKVNVDGLRLAETRIGLVGEQYRPRLPEPSNDATDVRISYKREIEVVTELASVLIPNYRDIRQTDLPRRVGEATFDYAVHNLLNQVNND
jgi:hypothetical protein